VKKTKGKIMNRLQRIKKGTPSFRMGYRYKDVLKGREYTVHPFGFTGVKVKLDSKGDFHAHGKHHKYN